MIGLLLAGIVKKHPDLEAPAPFKLAATAIILLIPFFPIDQLHPRFDAVLITGATAVLLTGPGEWFRRWPLARPLSVAGDWSYSIYLVHWPLYAFATNAFLGTIPTTLAIFLIPVSFALGYLQYQYVEQRFRFVWPANNSRYLRYLLAASLAVISPIFLYSFGATKSAGNIASLFRVNVGLGLACSYRGDFDNRAQCRLEGDPRVVLWGDSFAMVWASGLADALDGQGLVQITRSACGPFQELAAVFEQVTRWAADCIQFNKSALQYIRKTDSIKTVVLSSSFDYYWDSILVGDKVEKSNTETLRRYFLATVSALRAERKNVIVISPVPRTTNHINIGECLQRRLQGVFVFPVLRSDCSFSYDSYRAAQQPVIEFLQTMERLDQLKIIWPESVTCDKETCVAQIGETPLYVDDGHITYNASILLARMLDIADKLDLGLQRPANAVAEPTVQFHTSRF